MESSTASPRRTDRRDVRDGMATLSLTAIVVGSVSMLAVMPAGTNPRSDAPTAPASAPASSSTIAYAPTPGSGNPPDGMAPAESAAWRPLPAKTARFARHWAYQPIADPTVPHLSDAATRSGWPRNDIDRFILARLEREDMQPSPEADRRTLLRRAHLDLTGIPPTAAEVESFLSDPSPDAYERRLEVLLASPLYGERWGRHWLDVARYADSNGVDENIAYANAFRYRDYVIDAFNRDLPFDQFLIEQIAGDLLPEAENPTAEDDHRTRSRIAALGFLALGPKMLAEPDKEKERVDVVDEQIDVVTKAFLGQTIACARCHDHKFDPVSDADYFALSGVFRSVPTFDNIATVGRVAQRPLATAAEVKRTEEWRARAKELDEARQRAEAARNEVERAMNRARWAEVFANPSLAPLHDALRSAKHDAAR